MEINSEIMSGPLRPSCADWTVKPGWRETAIFSNIFEKNEGDFLSWKWGGNLECVYEGKMCETHLKYRNIIYNCIQK